MKFDPVTQGKGTEILGKYLNLKDGDSAKLVLVGELHKRYELWVDGKSKEVPPTTPGAKARYSVNVVVANGTDLEVKVFQFGKMIHDQLAASDKDLREEGLDITSVKLKISRTGTKLDTTYTVTNLGPVDPKTLAKVKSLKLHVLGSSVPQEEDIPFGEPPPSFTEQYPQDDDELPF